MLDSEGHHIESMAHTLAMTVRVNTTGDSTEEFALVVAVEGETW